MFIIIVLPCGDISKAIIACDDDGYNLVFQEKAAAEQYAEDAYGLPDCVIVEV
jgi:hypothetical protein